MLMFFPDTSYIWVNYHFYRDHVCYMRLLRLFLRGSIPILLSATPYHRMVYLLTSYRQQHLLAILTNTATLKNVIWLSHYWIIAYIVLVNKVPGQASIQSDVLHLTIQGVNLDNEEIHMDATYDTWIECVYKLKSTFTHTYELSYFLLKSQEFPTSFPTKCLKFHHHSHTNSLKCICHL